MASQQENQQPTNAQTTEAEVDAVSLFNQLEDEDSQDSTVDSETRLDQQSDNNAQQPQTTQPGVGTETGNDPWANAPSELREEHQRLQQDYEKQQGQLRAMGGRQKKIQEQAALIEQLQQRDREGLDLSSKLQGKELKEVEEDFPEVASFVRQHVEAAVTHVIDRMRPHDEHLQQQAQQVHAATRQMELNELAQRHPDYQQIQADQTFHDWVGKQGPGIQSLYQSESASDADLLLIAYKQANGQPASRTPQQRLAQHASLPTKGAGRQLNTPDLDPVALFNAIND